MIWKSKRLLFSACTLLAGGVALAGVAKDTAAAPSVWKNPFVLVMVGLMIILLLVIKSLASTVLTAARRSWEKESARRKVSSTESQSKDSLAGQTVTAGDACQIPGTITTDEPARGDEKKSDLGRSPGLGGATGILLFGMLLGASLLSGSPALASGANDSGITGTAAASVSTTLINGLSDSVFYMIVSVVGLELMVVLWLLFWLNSFRNESLGDAAEVEKARKRIDFRGIWARMNHFRSATEEAEIDTGHDYDGIRELDNKMPPWWIYGFYCTIIFAVIYLWRYHVVHSAPLPAEEYQIAVKQAAADQQEYLKHAANAVDENTVKLLTSQADVAAGKAVFQSTCFSCHGSKGEGGVGPNLTDAYWLHGGTINEVFKTIKYGWPEKGMPSWKAQFSPQQIAQIASYVKSLGGSNPPNAKAPQGTLMK